MTLRTHLSRDYSEASASRLRRHCYHSDLVRLKDANTDEYSNNWICVECKSEVFILNSEFKAKVNDR